jgi:translation initiation factor 1 (eIF-1/SUI1)
MLAHPRRLGEASKAAASHSQVRIAMLQREMERQKTRISELEASGAELRELVRARIAIVP